MEFRRLLIFGLGYSGLAVAQAARRAGWDVAGTYRDKPPVRVPAGTTLVPFAEAAPLLDHASHILATAPPDEQGDPVLRRHERSIVAAPHLRWIGYLSTTGVYGNRDGAWVDETTPPAPTAERSVRRLAAEQAWKSASAGRALDIFRLGGIYGPARSAFDELRAGRARRVVKPGHEFGRIHREDIAGAVLAAMAQDRPPGPRILNLTDEEPAESATVIAEAAQLLGLPAPPEIPFAEAWDSMSPMARSFWAEDRKVSSRRTQEMLGYRWRHPTYREGLRAILAEEGLQGFAQQP